MKFKAFHLRKDNSGFVDEVNIGKEAIFDVYDTTTSLSVSESRECNIEKKKHRKYDFLNVFFFIFTTRVVLYAHLAHLSALVKNMKNFASSK